MREATLIGLLSGMFIGAFILGIITVATGHKWDSTIIEQGCAEYNSTTGLFQWKNN